MARVAVSNRPKVMTYFNFSGSTPKVEVASDASLLITNDLDLQVLFLRTSTTHFGGLLTRMNFFGSVYGFNFSMDNAAGRLSYRWSPTGLVANVVAKNTSTTAYPLTLGVPIWLRVTHDVDNGASGNDVRFYWGTYQGNLAPPSTWNQIGATQNTAGTTSIHNTISLAPPNGQAVNAGSYASGSGGGLPGGRIYRAIFRNGIDGPILVDIDPTNSGFFFAGAAFIEPSNSRVGTISGGVAVTKSRSTASGRVSAP